MFKLLIYWDALHYHHYKRGRVDVYYSYAAACPFVIFINLLVQHLQLQYTPILIEYPLSVLSLTCKAIWIKRI